MSESPDAPLIPESWHQNLIRSAQDYGVISMDLQGIVFAWNPGATRLFQYADTEMLRRSGDLIFTPEDLRRGTPDLERAAAREYGSTADERWHVRKDGTRFWASGRLIVVRDAGGVTRGLAKIVQDRTLEKATHDALRQSEDRSRLISRATNDIIWDWDLNTHRITWSDAASNHFGANADAFAATIERWKAHLHPDDRERVWRELEAAIADGANGWSARYKFLCASGYQEFFDRGTIARDDHGHAVRIVSSMLNVSNDRRAEHTLRETQARIERQNAELEARVAQRTRDLSAALNHLEEFSYSMSHDLKGPAHTIRGLLDVLRDDRPSPAESADLIQRLHRNAVTLCSLIEEMVNFSAIGLATAKLEPVELDPLLEQIIADLERREAGALRHIRVRSPLGTAVSDATLLRHALRNLVSNALKFVAPGALPQVSIFTERRGERIRLHVKDAGIGIEPRFHDQIFELFRRLHHPRMYPGYGAGLATVKRATEKIGGNVSFESEVGKGTTFTLDLPAPPEH